MKWIFAFLLVSTACYAHVIGEIFEETAFGKPGPNVKIEHTQPQPKALKKVYVVKMSSLHDEASFIVCVSTKTGRIISINEKVESIYDAVLQAAYYCEGEVSLPVKAYWPGGFVLENTPDMTQKGRYYSFRVTKTKGMDFTLESSCEDYHFK